MTAAEVCAYVAVVVVFGFGAIQAGEGEVRGMLLMLAGVLLLAWLCWPPSTPTAPAIP